MVILVISPKVPYSNGDNVLVSNKTNNIPTPTVTILRKNENNPEYATLMEDN